ncbi:MAG: cell wall hydrolase [Ruminococcus sp.]|nr:cell wall hydrolase [Ruminococcus sp.]
MQKTNFSQFIKALAILLLVITLIAAFSYALIPTAKSSVSAVSSLGSSGAEVKAIQERLKERGLFNDDITGYYGEKTEAAVKRFQKQQGISQTGTAGPQTLAALGISVGAIPEATEANVYLLARIISAEARGEPYTGQVAVGAVILNRIEHPSFPDTLAGVIYQNGAFTAIVDGQFDEPIADSAYSAARDALNGWDPTGGCVYYYNPDKTSNSFMWSLPTVMTIGSHRFSTG